MIGQIFTDDYEPSVAEWCNANGAYIEEIEAVDGHRRFEVKAIPEPTAEEQQQALVERFRSAIQAWMDASAQELGYDNIITACTYINTGNSKFDAEGEGFRAWRSAVWARGYELIDEVISGQREIPDDPADVIALLPQLEITYPEE